MKKSLLILLISFFSFQSFAQDPDPELFRTWYLYFIQASDVKVEYNVSEINPVIHPFITISENLNFNGEGACNTFNGNYEHLGTNYLEAITFNNTANDCENQVHNSFEGDYFGFMQSGFWYSISQDSDGLTLRLDHLLMGYAIFKDYPLSTSDFTINDIVIYPNPVSDQLFITSENTVIETISIYTLTGKNVLEVINETNSIDVSSFSKGVYFIEISSATGKSIKKFIKK